MDPEKHKQQAYGYLKKELGMSDAEVTLVLSTLAQPLKKTLQEAEFAYLSGSSDKLAIASHSLKGALLNLGLNDLALVAKNIERAGKNHDKNFHEEKLAFLRGNLAGLVG